MFFLNKIYAAEGFLRRAKEYLASSMKSAGERTSPWLERISLYLAENAPILHAL